MPAPSPVDTARPAASAAAALAAAETVTAVVVPPGAAPAARPPRGRGRRRRATPEPTVPAVPTVPSVPAGHGAPGGPGQDAASDVVRWAAFCCVLVPVVLLVYGTSVGGAAGAAVGLVAVTAACRMLLRRSERGLLAEAREGGNRARGPRDHSRS
ncbi:hypothetical protein [Streptomyces sp. NPDC053431]|uniref:hypothetical protein n=1 Tax=Streptomyces sp. NPDC053431 TaxID=3365703 RepID=UPI0037D46572